MGRRELHSVGHQLEDELVAHGPAVLGNEVGARLPEGHAPDFALGMDLIGIASRARAKHRGVIGRAGRAVIRLRRINVLERQRIFREVRAVGIAPDAKVVIL